MKTYSQLLALCVFYSNVWGNTAFCPRAPKASSAVLLRSSASPDPPPPGVSEPSSELAAPNLAIPGSPGFEMFPPGTFDKLETIEGGGTVRTYQMPPYAERCQYFLTTNGRPLKATIELWLGPIRKTHTMKIDAMNGMETPYMATLKFRKQSQVLRIRTSKDFVFPVLASVSVPSPERSEELGANTEAVWESVPPEQKLLVQGGSTMGGGGAIRTWKVPIQTETVQVLGWARDTGKKSFKVKMEILNGPNNKRQDVFLQCGGGSQPYHTVIQTPGDGWQIRVTNQKFVEDGLVQISVVGDGVVGEEAIDSQTGWQTSGRPGFGANKWYL